MITLQINAESRELQTGCTVSDALASLGYASTDIAVAINGEFVARSMYHNTFLNDGDALEIVAPVQGG